MRDYDLDLLLETTLDALTKKVNDLQHAGARKEVIEIFSKAAGQCRTWICERGEIGRLDLVPTLYKDYIRHWCNYWRGLTRYEDKNLTK